MCCPRGRAELGRGGTLEVGWSLAGEVPWRSGGAWLGRYPGGQVEPRTREPGEHLRNAAMKSMEGDRVWS